MLPAKANNVNSSLIFSQKTVGDFDITVLVNGEPIANSPIHVRIVTGRTLLSLRIHVYILPDVLFASHTIAPVDPSRTALIAPSSVEAGLPCTLTICAKDHFGNPRTSGDDLFEVTLADATGWYVSTT